MSYNQKQKALAPKAKKYGDVVRDDPSYTGQRSTLPPRTREGIGNANLAQGEKNKARVTASSVYPGGRDHRRAQARLSARQADYAKVYKPGVEGKSVNGDGYMTKPGSMKI